VHWHKAGAFCGLLWTTWRGVDNLHLIGQINQVTQCAGKEKKNPKPINAALPGGQIGIKGRKTKQT
jgi:hypothetical protein